MYTFLLILFLQVMFFDRSGASRQPTLAACFPCSTSSARLPTPVQFPRSHGSYSSPSFRQIPACFSISFWSILRSSLMVRVPMGTPIVWWWLLGCEPVTVCNVVVRRSRCPMLSNGSWCRGKGVLVRRVSAFLFWFAVLSSGVCDVVGGCGDKNVEAAAVLLIESTADVPIGWCFCA